MTKEEKKLKAVNALNQVIPLLKARNFNWVITGGFACYVYGVDRDITDIDLDIDTSKDDPLFQSFIKALEPYITQPLENYVDQNYNNYNFEATFDDLVVDVCPTHLLKFSPDKLKSLRNSLSPLLVLLLKIIRFIFRRLVCPSTKWYSGSL